MTHQARVTSSVSNCDEVEYSESSIMLVNGEATASTSTWKVANVSEDDMGFCSTDEARSKASGQPCHTYVSITGRRVSVAP